MRMTRLFIVALVGLAALAARAQWEWTDKDGRHVFSDRAPALDVPEKSILKRPLLVPARPLAPVAPRAPGVTAIPAPAPTSPVSPVAALAAQTTPPKADSAAPAGGGVDRELQERKRKADEAQAGARRAEEEKQLKLRAENCARARQAKAGLDAGQRVARTNEKGEREVLDDAMRAKELQRLQEVITSECR